MSVSAPSATATGPTMEPMSLTFFAPPGAHPATMESRNAPAPNPARNKSHATTPSHTIMLFPSFQILQLHRNATAVQHRR